MNCVKLFCKNRARNEATPFTDSKGAMAPGPGTYAHEKDVKKQMDQEKLLNKYIFLTKSHEITCF